MKNAHVIVVLVVVLGVMGGYLAYPRPPELALIHYKNQQYTAARAEYENLLAAGDTSANVVLPLSDLYLIYGEMGKAVELMESFVERHPDNMEARARLSKYYQQTQRPHDYLGSLEERAQAQPSEEALRHLSQLYNAEGRYAQQIEVLRHILLDYDAKPQDYMDLAYLLAAEGEMMEAVDVVRRLSHDHPRSFDLRAREFLVSLLLDLGQYEDAIAYLREHAHRGGRWMVYYEQALVGAGRYADLFAFWDRWLARSDLRAKEIREISYRYEATLRKLGKENRRIDFLRQQLHRPGIGAVLRREFAERYETALRDNGRRQALIAFLRERIEGEDLTPRQREGLTYRYESLMQEEKREEELLAFWRQQLARTDLGSGERKRMRYRFEGMLEKTGQRRELLAILHQRLNRPGLPPGEKQELAYRLLGLGDRHGAERLFRELAENEPADGPNVNQLLYLWGPRPEPSGIQWLEKRARSSRGAERLAWLHRLMEVGATDRALEIGQQELAALGYEGEPLEFQMDILQREEDYPRLRQVLARAIERSASPGQLRRFLRRAEQAGLMDLATAASRRLLAMVPGDAEALRRLALSAYQERRWGEAYDRLGRYLSRIREDDYEAHYFYAELLIRRNERLRAISHYRRTLALLSALPRLDVRQAAMQAQSLYRTGERERALMLFRELLESYPENRQLIADYATVLLEMGEIEQAGAVLSKEKGTI